LRRLFANLAIDINGMDGLQDDLERAKPFCDLLWVVKQRVPMGSL
jgi:hypothetical protein